MSAGGLRDMGCRACQRSTGMDCGGHGPRVVTTSVAPQRIAGVSGWIEVERAVICLDCEALYALPLAACPRCGSGSAMPVSRALGRAGTFK